MSLQAISSLDELAKYLGYKDYESFKGLVYPSPFYRSFKLPKKNGGERLIETPGKNLKQVQRKIATDLAEIFGKRSPSANSFVRTRSVVSNALPHVGRASVVRVDVDWHRDIAVLRPKPLVSIPRNLAYFEPAKPPLSPEATLGIIGFPSSNEHQPPIFMRASAMRIRGYHGVTRIEIDKPILEGNSGGPVFDEHYRLIGIVVEGASVKKGMNSCISVSELDTLKKY